MTSKLRSRLIRLAHEKPELRSDLLPLITAAKEEKLSPAIVRVLQNARGRSSTHSGRGGWSENVMIAMEKKGLVTKGRVSTWETFWDFTEKGKALSRQLAEEAKF